MNNPSDAAMRLAHEIEKCIIETGFGSKQFHHDLAAHHIDGHTEAAVADYKRVLAECEAAAQQVINRWDSPHWKWDDQHTGDKIDLLRKVLAALAEAGLQEKDK